ncbi:MAG TPA: PKD domain-containing protein [Thermoleophilaceae bacterium]
MRSLLIPAFVAVSLVIAPAARADVFFVDPGGNNAGSCTSAGAGACQTIAGAVVKARAIAGGDTINLAAGTYEEDLNFDQADDDGDSIVGAGPAATKILHKSTDGNSPGVDIGGVSLSPEPHFQMSDLTIEQDANGSALDLRTTSATLSNLAITLTNPSNGNTAVNVVVGDATFNGLKLSGAWTGSGIAAQALALDLNDSSITTNGNGLPVSIIVSGSLDIERSVLAANPSSSLWVVSTTNADVTIDSSLLTGGTAGLLAGTNNQSHTALLRNVTIDSGNPGVADAGDSGVWSDAAHSTDSMQITLDSSITLEGQKVDNTPGTTVSCTNSDVPNQVVTGIACGAAGNNTASAPSDLFVNPTGGDYHLKPSPLSPAVDTGSSAALAVGESTTDLDGRPRVADGNFDCTARRDKGAYELPPPAASIGAPDQALLGAAVAFSGQISLDPPADPLTFGWTFSDGGSASSQNVSHAFTALGGQQATLKVTDPHGCFVTATHGIAIAPQPTEPAPPASPAPPGSPAGSHSVRFRLGRGGRQKLGKFVTVKLTCPTDACKASAGGSLNVPGAAKRYKLKNASRSLKAGASTTLKLAVPKKARKAALHALRRHKKVTARLRIEVTSSAANPAAASKTVTLRR